MKSLIYKILAMLGFELRRLGPTGYSRETHPAGLQIAVQNGLRVNSVLDVGAAFGGWTRMCQKILPQARYVLVEPLAQYTEWLDTLLGEIPDAMRIKAAAFDSSGSTTFFLHDDWVGSSLYPETEGPEINEIPVQIDTTTIDEIVNQHKLVGPFLLKIDVQGAEVKVLKGAITTLQQTEYLLVETSLFEFFKDGPLIHDLVAYMQQQGFVIYDILGAQYRLLDNALGQVDLAFVPEFSLLRKEHIYASSHQRKKQTENMLRNIKHNKSD